MKDAIRTVRWLSGTTLILAAVTLLASCTAREKPTAAPAPAAKGSAAAAGAHSGHGAPVPPPPAEPLRTSERFVNLKLPAPYTPKAPSGGTDEYRCFLVDPGLTRRAFLTGSQFFPQNTELVHHAIIFRIGPDTVEAAQKLDARTPGEGWTCFGDSGIGEDSAWIGHWAPGANETLLTQKVGYPMPAGSRLVVQVHYNLLASEGRLAGSDQSAIRLRVNDGEADLSPLDTAQVMAPIELPCATGESGPLCDREAAIKDVAHRFGKQAETTVAQLNQYCNAAKPPAAGVTQTCLRQSPQSGTVYAVAGHMHLLGRSIKVELNPGKPGARTLLDIPEYNFDSQAIRPLAKPVKIRAGDELKVTCTHDAGLRRMLPALKNSPPRYVVWGEGTSDEMCLGLLIWSPKPNKAPDQARPAR